MMVRLFSRDAVAKSPCTCGSLPGIYNKILFNADAILPTSSNELSFPREMRIVPLATDSSVLIACNTWEICVLLLSHAEPVDT